MSGSPPSVWVELIHPVKVLQVSSAVIPTNTAFFFQSVCQHENAALDASDEEGANPATKIIDEDNESNDHSSKGNLGVSNSDEQEKEGRFAQQMSLKRDEKDAQASEGIEMTAVKVRKRHK